MKILTTTEKILISALVILLVINFIVTMGFINTDDSEEKEVVDYMNSDIGKMDLGFSIYRDQIIKYDCNIEKSDSAYNKIKMRVIKDVYKTALKPN